MPLLRRLAPALALLCLGASALALTLEDVQQEANAIEATYAELATRVGACPGGDCPGRAAIEEDFDSAELERGDLHESRASISPCTTCGSIDQQIADIDALANYLRTVIVDWEVSG